MRDLIERHVQLHRQRARGAHPRRLVERRAALFVKVMPRDYKRVLAGAGAARGSAEGRRAAHVHGARSAQVAVQWVSRPASSKSSARSSRTRPVAERVHDWREVYLPYPRAGAARIRPRAAWTAASRSAIRAARSAT